MAAAASGNHFDPLSSKAIKIYLFRKSVQSCHCSTGARESVSQSLTLRRSLCVLCSLVSGDKFHKGEEMTVRKQQHQRSCRPLMGPQLISARFFSLSLSLSLCSPLQLNPKMFKNLEQVMDKANKDVKLVTGGESHCCVPTAGWCD